MKNTWMLELFHFHHKKKIHEINYLFIYLFKYYSFFFFSKYLLLILKFLKLKHKLSFLNKNTINFLNKNFFFSNKFLTNKHINVEIGSKLQLTSNSVLYNNYTSVSTQ